MPFTSPPFEPPHLPNPTEKVGSESASKEAWLRYVIGIPFGVLFTIAMLVWSGPNSINVGGPVMLITVACLILAPVVTVVAVIQIVKYFNFRRRIAGYQRELREIHHIFGTQRVTRDDWQKLRDRELQAKHDLHETVTDFNEWRGDFGMVGPALFAALATYGWVAWVIWIVQTAEG